MRIAHLRLANFRSVVEAAFHATAFNIFVGQNNHGKTNIFEAVEWFFEGPKKGQDVADLIFARDATRDMFVELRFDGALDGARAMKNESNKTKMLGVLGECDSVTVRRSSRDPKKRTLAVGGQTVDKLPTGFDAAFNDFLPKFEYIDTKKYFEDVAKYSKGTPVAIMLSAVLTTILENSQQYRQFQDKFDALFGAAESDVRVQLDRISGKVKAYLQRQFPDTTKVTFEVNPPAFEDLLKSFDTSVDDGIETSAAEKGDGMQRALMLSILQAYADFRRENEDIGKSFLFFIDEAELHLHPTAQRKLKNVLIDLAKGGDQVFLNTHSSVLVVDDSEGQTIFTVEKLKGETMVSETNASHKPAIIFDLLGGTPGDLLLPQNFLIVEGKSERTFLMLVIERHYADMPKIQIVPACGDIEQVERSINAIEQAFKPLGQTIYCSRLVMLIDRPKREKQAAVDNFLQNYPSVRNSGRLRTLPCCSIEEYYPAQEDWRRSADAVSNMSGAQKVSLANRVGSAVTREQFEKDMAEVHAALRSCWESAFR